MLFLHKPGCRCLHWILYEKPIFDLKKTVVVGAALAIVLTAVLTFFMAMQDEGFLAAFLPSLAIALRHDTG